MSDYLINVYLYSLLSPKRVFYLLVSSYIKRMKIFVFSPSGGRGQASSYVQTMMRPSLCSFTSGVVWPVCVLFLYQLAKY
jgi:hypothetical protein